MHISEKTTRKQLAQAAFENPTLLAHLGGALTVSGMETDELREAIINWIVEGDEAGTVSQLNASVNETQNLSRMNIWQDRLGEKWVTWMGYDFHDFRNPNKATPKIIGTGWEIEESAKEFCKSLDRAIKAGEVSIFEGTITLVDHNKN